jgi:hypothetical protein
MEISFGREDSMTFVKEEDAEKKLCPFKDSYCITCGCMAWEYGEDAEDGATGRCRLIPE